MLPRREDNHDFFVGQKSFDAVKSLAYNIFDEQVYCAEDKELHDLAAQLLKLNNKMLAVAESLTGGEICSRLTSVAGISENFSKASCVITAPRKCTDSVSRKR